MNRRSLLTGAALLVLALPWRGLAPAKAPRIRVVPLDPTRIGEGTHLAG